MPFLHPNDLVRLVSPASRPDRAEVERRTDLLRDWGLRVEVARHAFDRYGYLAGTDDDRLSDLTEALLDRNVRTVFATRGGKGSYRIAHRLPFDAIARDPKPIVGFSDITALHLSLLRGCGAMGVHGALTGDADDRLSPVAAGSLRSVLMEDSPVVVEAEPANASTALTTSGIARGCLIGGNLEMIATAAGWALPSLKGAILLVESAGLGIGQFDRILTMLVQAGHLNDIAGIAVGRIDGTPGKPPLEVIEVLRQHLSGFRVPILGGLPIGHDADARSVVVGMVAEIDAGLGVLIQRGAFDPNQDEAERAEAAGGVLG